MDNDNRFPFTNKILDIPHSFLFRMSFFLALNQIYHRGRSRTAATSKMEHFAIIVNGYYHKALHLGCCSSPRSTSVPLDFLVLLLYLSCSHSLTASHRSNLPERFLSKAVLKILQNWKETISAVFNKIALSRPTLSTRGSTTGASLWVLLNCWEQPFYWHMWLL